MVGLWPLCSGMTPWRWVRKEAVLPGRRVAWLEQATWQALARGRGQRRWSSGARERVWGCGLCALALRTQAPRSAEHSWEPWIVLKSGSQRPIDETCPWAGVWPVCVGLVGHWRSKGNALFFPQLINLLGCVSS